MRVVQFAAVITLSLLVLLAHLALSDPKPVEIRISPQVLMAGGAFWLTCRVPHNARNRRLDYGVVDLRDSQRQLEGEQAPMTFQTLIEHVPCDVGPAYCAVIRNDGSFSRAIQAFQVADCH